MEVNLRQAIKKFFSNSSLEMVYKEAVANALDAGASRIDIDIQMTDIGKPESLEIIIKDNGVGFTDERFMRFSKLFDTSEISHKGLGRLVYLCYFDNVDVSSSFLGGNRHFVFCETFDKDKCSVEVLQNVKSGTTFKMTQYSLSKLGKNDYVDVKYLKKMLLEEFYGRLYSLKNEGVRVQINMSSKIGSDVSSEEIDTTNIPELNEIELDEPISTVDKLRLCYYIKSCSIEKSSMIAALVVDGRTFKMNKLIAEEYIPTQYEMVFLLFSDFFQGKSDESRQTLKLSQGEIHNIEGIFRKAVINQIENVIPHNKEKKKKVKEALFSKYPHLIGFFDETNVGYVANNDAIESAQKKMFKVQKEILNADIMDDQLFENALKLSSHSLAEYILFRQTVINRLKEIGPKDAESKIHNLIVPMKETLRGRSSSEEVYLNNAWIFDDKYMTYKTILSDEEMTKVIDAITEGESREKDKERPDLTFVFSNNPEENSPLDVVVVELKKKNIDVDDAMTTEVQLRQRAIKLMKFYGNRIQRIWFYGVVEMTEELEEYLQGEYKELFSKGKIYYKESAVVSKKDDGSKIEVPIGLFLLDIDTIVNDADARNSTFLNLLKNEFQKGDK